MAAEEGFDPPGLLHPDDFESPAITYLPLRLHPILHCYLIRWKMGACQVNCIIPVEEGRKSTSVIIFAEDGEARLSPRRREILLIFEPDTKKPLAAERLKDAREGDSHLL